LFKKTNTWEEVPGFNIGINLPLITNAIGMRAIYSTEIWKLFYNEKHHQPLQFRALDL